MTSTLALVLLTGLLCWTVAGYAIWKWGPGLRTRRVRCPVLKRRARVLADQREVEFACLKVADVKRCSLMSGSITCGKECLQRL
jgi:hypothetical protein